MMKIIWHRVAMVWAVCILVIVGSSVLLAKSANAYEDAHSLPIPVLTLLAEAGGEGFDGMVAVGNVIRNRAKLRGQTVEEVCLAPKQFSCWNGKGWVVNHIERNRWVIDRAWAAWRASATEDVTLGSDHYFADYIKRPRWAKDMTFKARVGKHLFYRS